MSRPTWHTATARRLRAELAADAALPSALFSAEAGCPTAAAPQEPRGVPALNVGVDARARAREPASRTSALRDCLQDLWLSRGARPS